MEGLDESYTERRLTTDCYERLRSFRSMGILVIECYARRETGNI